MNRLILLAFISTTFALDLNLGLGDLLGGLSSALPLNQASQNSDRILNDPLSPDTQYYIESPTDTKTNQQSCRITKYKQSAIVWQVVYDKSSSSCIGDKFIWVNNSIVATFRVKNTKGQFHQFHLNPSTNATQAFAGSVFSSPFRNTQASVSLDVVAIINPEKGSLTRATYLVSQQFDGDISQSLNNSFQIYDLFIQQNQIYVKGKAFSRSPIPSSANNFFVRASYDTGSVIQLQLSSDLKSIIESKVAM